MVESHCGLLEISFPRRQPSLKTLRLWGESSAIGLHLGSDRRPKRSRPTPTPHPRPSWEATLSGRGPQRAWGISGPSGETRNFHRQVSPRILPGSPGRGSLGRSVTNTLCAELSNTTQTQARWSVRKSPGLGGWFSHGQRGLSRPERWSPAITWLSLTAHGLC